ncbi:MAG TPA: DNA-binding response regulator [Cytophagales bacterium]|jgi:DNA-binding LytR/AlgR family response regulator|nr:DNA-binding response regulator [Cytophagales bacterium]
MKIIIIEDEPLSATRLEKMVYRVDRESEVIAKIQSVKQSIAYFDQSPLPDLLLCDIQLGDGLSFDIFENIKIDCPVIFTTAYDEYAIEAFKLNSVDYLLKPIKEEALEKALTKYRTLFGKQNAPDTKVIDEIKTMLANPPQKYKSRFVVKLGEQIRIVEQDMIAYFMSEQKATFLVNNEGQHLPVDRSLDQLEIELDPKKFFRISRKYIIHYPAIDRITAYSSSRLRVFPNFKTKEELIVSRDKVNDFKNWLEG